MIRATFSMQAIQLIGGERADQKIRGPLPEALQNQIGLSVSEQRQ